MTRALLSATLAGMIINDLWPNVARNLLALDPMRPDLHQFVTLAFVPWGLVSFLVNGMLLLVLGTAVERALGPVRMFIVYLGSALFGGIGYLAVSSLEWAPNPLPAAGVAAAGIVGGTAGLRLRVWTSEPLFTFGERKCSWGMIAGLGATQATATLFFWLSGTAPFFTGTVALAHLFGFMGGLITAVVVDWIGRALLPPPPTGRTRAESPGPGPVPFPKSASIHPFSQSGAGREAFAQQTTETAPVRREAATPQTMTEVMASPLGTPSPGIGVDPKLKAILHAINACNPAAAYRLYREWQGSDGEQCLPAPDQWRLAQLLISAQNVEAALGVLKKLIARHPACYWLANAHAELGFLYSRMAGRRHDAVEHLMAALTIADSKSEDGPKALAPQLAERVRTALRDLGQTAFPTGSGQKSVASLQPVRDKLEGTSIMPKKPLPPTGPNAPKPDPEPPVANTYSNVFGDPEATGNFAPLTLDEDAPVRIPKMYGAPPSGNIQDPAPKSSAPSPTPGAGSQASRSSAPAPSPDTSALANDPFSESDQSGVFKQSLWEDSKKPKKEIKYTAPSGPQFDLDESKPIVFEESTSGIKPAEKKGGLTDVFGSPGGTTGLVPPDWSNVAGTGEISADNVPPMPEPGLNSAPFWNKSSPFLFSDEEKGIRKKKSGDDRFATPPPSAPNAVGGGEKARALKKREVKAKDDVDFFPTPAPFTVKGAEEDVFHTPPKPMPSPVSKAEDRFATPPPKPIVPAHEPRIASPPASAQPSQSVAHLHVSQAGPSSGTDVWSAFLKEDRGWSESSPKSVPMPAAPPDASRSEQEKIIPDSAPTVQRPAAHPMPPPPAGRAGAEIGFAGSSPDQTMVWSRQYAAERSPTFHPNHTYNIIIAPASALMMREILGLLRSQLGMNEEAALYALKHRHGILLSDLVLEEAVEMCRKFSDMGQDVALIEQDDRLEFGEPADVMRVKLEEKSARYFTMDAAHARKWKSLIGLSCGRIVIHPGAPGRDVLDLFFAEPGLNLRLWRNTLMSAPPIFTGKINNEGEFQSLGREIVKRAPHAIQTQSFIEWTQADSPEMPVEFSNFVEYQNYTRWYLMAHYGRSKLFPAGKRG